MPLYEYECTDCQKRIEKIQRFSDPPLEVCPSCGGAVKRLIHAPAVQFKGAGWYVTDYGGKTESRREGEKKDASTTTESTAKSESKESKSSESTSKTSSSDD